MMTWWPLIGETSLMAGGALGFGWAVISTSRRRQKFLSASLPPQGQVRWFVLNLVSMTCYLTLVAAIGLASLHDMVPAAFSWFLLAMATLAFTCALLFPSIETMRGRTSEIRSQEPPVNPPILPLRRSA